MLSWLEQTFHQGRSVELGLLATRLLLSLVFGAIVAGIYVLTQRRPRSELIPFATTAVLLTVLIAMVTQVIGDNIARAFSLAGALAIIRFRTIVEDTRDTAFVIFAVVVGMAVGADLVIIPLVGVPIVGVAAWVLSYFGRVTAVSTIDFSLNIRLGLGRDPSSVLSEIFNKHLTMVRLRATTTARQGAALDLSYVVRLRREQDAVAFVTDLNGIEGVQNVELRQL
jgi:hypothetical protein